MSRDPTRAMVMATGVRGLVAFEATAGSFIVFKVLGEWRPSLGEYAMVELDAAPGTHCALTLAGGRSVAALVFQVGVSSELLHQVLLGF